MKAISAELTASTTTTYGDTTKTYLAGRVKAKTVGGKSVLSTSLTTFADVQTALGVSPGHCIANPSTSRKFELANVTTNTPTVLAFNFDFDTGTWTYIGKIILNLPLGTHSFRGFDFDDSDTSNIKIFVSSTVTTALCQGGTYYTWGVNLSDFTVAGTTIYMATATNQKAVYFAQYSGQLGLNHTGTTSGGVGHGRVLNTLANKTKFFQQNGTAALPVIYGWDTSLGNPAVAGTVTNGIASQTTPFAGTSPSAYFSMGASQNGYSTTANTAGAFESVVLQNGSTNIPSNFVATPANSVQTLYYMRDLQLVSGVWYFNLATTATGAAVVPATTSATFTMMRGNGISSTHSLFRTGNLTPALTGTITQANSFGAVVPTNVPAAETLNAQDCLFICTTTNLYMGKVSDLSDGGTTWSSNSGVNIFGNGLDITTPSLLFGRYSSYLDRWVYVTNTSKFVMKQHQNSVIDKVFGALSNVYLETNNFSSVPLGMTAIVSLNISGGWFFIAGSTVGQRGVISCDLLSDSSFDNSYLISKVLSVPPGSILRFFTTDEALAEFTCDTVIYLRSGATATDPIFNSASGGWTQYDPYQDESPAALGPYFQVKLAADIINDNSSTSSPQLHDFVIAYDEPGEINKNFTWQPERTSKSADTPMIVSVRQVQALAAAPTKFLLVGRDDSGNIVTTIDSSLTPSVIAQTANSGTAYTTFTNMAAFMGSFNSSSGNTELKFTISSPPAVPVVTWSFYYV